MPEHGPAVNLEHLRRQMTDHLAILLMVSTALVMLCSLPQEPFPLPGFCLLGILAALGQVVRVLLHRRPRAARQFLVCGAAGALLGAIGLFPNPWLPFLGLLVAFAGAMLAPGSELAAAGLVAAEAAWLVHTRARAYPLPTLLGGLAVATALGRVVAHTLYTALEWAWTMQERADRLLELSRDRQANLNRTLKSLELAYDLQRRTQDELVAARRRADEARRMKEQFAANISHELRTPLNLILGFSEVMHLSPEVYGPLAWPPALREDVSQIYHSSSHLLEMIDDILDLSRFEMVGFTLRREPTSPESLLRSTADIADDLFRGRPVRLEVSISPGLPELEVDRTRIRQVLLNLLNNAQRFTEEGTVRLEARQAGREVIFSVSDTGSGIPADRLPHIFEEFYQVDQSLSRRRQGAGLGLAICKRFVEAHEGRIWVESREGVGSTFFFALPVPGQYALAPQLRYQGAPPALARPGARPPVLVVEPDRAVAAMVRRHLQDYEVVQVADASQLAEATAAYHPHAVVRNVPPGERPVHEDGSTSPVIECSLPSPSWIAGDLGVVGCLTKPITSQEILQAMAGSGAIHDILIIDDDHGFGQLVQRMLQATGSDQVVRQVLSGEDGLAAMRERRPDLLLLDLIMPGMDGFQFLEAVRAEPGLAGVPVLLLTATNLAEDALQRRSGRLVLHRADGLQPAETLRCVRALLGTLEPAHSLRPAPQHSS